VAETGENNTSRDLTYERCRARKIRGGNDRGINRKKRETLTGIETLFATKKMAEGEEVNPSWGQLISVPQKLTSALISVSSFYKSQCHVLNFYFNILIFAAFSRYSTYVSTKLTQDLISFPIFSHN